MNLFIGCSCKDIDEKFIDTSRSLIESVAKIEDVHLVFGAYNHSLMKLCYDEFKKHNKKITGITITDFKEDLDMMELDEVYITNTTMDRMREIYQKSDAMLFLPGGIGTYAEILSSIEEKYSKQDNKLLILYNDDFFYTPFIKEMYWLYENKFVEKSIGEYIRIESVLEEIVKLIEKEKELWKS